MSLADFIRQRNENEPATCSVRPEGHLYSRRVRPHPDPKRTDLEQDAMICDFCDVVLFDWATYKKKPVSL